MIIKTTAKQDQEIQCWYRAIVGAHHAEGCEPPGFTLKIELGHLAHLGEIEGEAVCGTSILSLGAVDVAFT